MPFSPCSPTLLGEPLFSDATFIAKPTFEEKKTLEIKDTNVPRQEGLLSVTG